MADDFDDLRDERRGIVRWILDVAFGRSNDDDNEMGAKIHRIGTINRLLEDDD